MMDIIDWNGGLDEAIDRGIVTICSNPLLDSPEVCIAPKIGTLDYVAFLNFPKLKVKEMALSACEFKNCGELTFDDCEIEDCKFTAIDTMNFDDCEITGSQFKNLHSNCGELIILEDSTMSNCNFEETALENGSYLCVGYGESVIETSSFHGICTDRADKILCIYVASRKLCWEV